MWVFARTAREWCSSNQRGRGRREDERIEEGGRNSQCLLTITQNLHQYGLKGIFTRRAELAIPMFQSEKQRITKQGMALHFWRQDEVAGSILALNNATIRGFSVCMARYEEG